MLLCDYAFHVPVPIPIGLIVAPSHKSMRHEAVRAWLDSMSKGRKEKQVQKLILVLTQTHISAWQDY